MSIWRRFIDQMFGAPIPQPPGAPMAALARRRSFNPYPVRNTRSPRRKRGQGPVERANRVLSPAWWAWVNECDMIITQHHSLPHLHHLRDGLLARRGTEAG